VSGIIGKLSFDRDETLARPVLDQMLDASRHPGTRGQGIYIAPGIALGWCSDLQTPSFDPVTAGDDHDAVRVVADVVLTNARELRASLERLGHMFAGASDAEVVAHAYQEWGVRCVERLRGAFACAIWDERQRRLVLARDHAGLRPLYFALLHGHGIVFASEMRALLQDPGVRREWCPEAIDAYLALGYVPAPLTACRGVSKLEPAQRLVLDGRRFHVDEYWDLPEPDTRWGRSPAAAERLTTDIAATLEGTLQHVIRRDAGGGVDATLYSGGLASAALVASGAARAGHVVAVAIDRDTTELAHGFDLARRLECDVQVEIARADAAATVKQIASHLDEPTADPSAVWQYALYAAASAHTACAFTGHGAATLWAGATLHDVARCHHGIRRRAIDADADNHRALYTRRFAWDVRDANPFARELELYASRHADDPSDGSLYVRARTVLPDNTLATAARMATAAGVRLSFPFLDRAALELAAQVPAAFKPHVAGGMPIVRALIERHVPAAMLPSVQPAAAPGWLRDSVAPMVPSMLLSPRFDCRGIVSRPALRRVWDEHLTGRRDHTRQLWSLLMLELWFRGCIDGDAAEEPLEYAVIAAA
jgi:asparagine synthase (glutamine-hydrolysing)